jgi:hypothetical protein
LANNQPPRLEQTHPLLRRWLVSGIILGVIYGVALRFLVGEGKFNFNSGTTTYVMTIAFLFLGPLVIGLITINEAEGKAPTSIASWIFAPWIPTLLTCFVAVLFRWEGYICLIFALPITLLGSSFGGVLAGILARRRNAVSRPTLACFALLPLLLAPLESQLAPPMAIHTVASEIHIHASPETIWRNIERVPSISPNELQPTWTHRIGFPRPVEATLSFEGLGGVRHASFEHGLLFIETITDWEPNHRLAFRIKADTAHIPPTTLDEHVTIGGRYFDVLDGEYTLEPLANGDTMLHLASHERLSTDLNGYAGLWTDAVMQNLQSSILKVIQRRCEHA